LVGRLPALLAAIAAIALAGCGGGSGGGPQPKTVPASTLVSAARATAAAGPFTFTIGGTFAAVGQTLPIHGRGAVDAQARLGRASLDLSQAVAQIGIQSISAADARADAVIAGGVVYLRNPYLARRRGATKPWMRLASIPVRPLAYLQAVHVVKQLGTETIGGVRTTHYSTEIDLRKYARTARPAEASAVNSLIGIVGDSLPTDVWVDAHDRIRRLAVQVTTASVQAEPQVEISGFGRPVAIRRPPPALVAPAR
jgi:hypothetical protein